MTDDPAALRGPLSFPRDLTHTPTPAMLNLFIVFVVLGLRASGRADEGWEGPGAPARLP